MALPGSSWLRRLWRAKPQHGPLAIVGRNDREVSVGVTNEPLHNCERYAEGVVGDDAIRLLATPQRLLGTTEIGFAHEAATGGRG
jgi:hypothetical protein